MLTILYVRRIVEEFRAITSQRDKGNKCDNRQRQNCKENCEQATAGIRGSFIYLLQIIKKRQRRNWKKCLQISVYTSKYPHNVLHK